MVFTGFEKIVEERIRQALGKGEFDNLPGAGKPLRFDQNPAPEELRLAYKILKNADCLPPELELQKEITRTEDLLAGMADTGERYCVLKKLNFLIMKLNAMRNASIRFEMPQRYETRLLDRLSSESTPPKG